jgi:flagellar biosynthetic protein FliP
VNPQQAAEGLSVVVDGGGPATLKIFFLMTVLSLLPAIVLSMTSFVRVVIVLSFLRTALGTPQLPPNPVLIGLSIFLSFFIMGRTFDDLNATALQPYLDDKIGYVEAGDQAAAVMKAFMLPQTRDEDLALFYDLGHLAPPASVGDIPLRVAVPAFLVSELTTAFKMGLYLFVPLVLIDILVASVLMSLGMMMVPPAMVALPLKIAVFLLADGWRLVVAALARSFHGA